MIWSNGPAFIGIIRRISAFAITCTAMVCPKGWRTGKSHGHVPYAAVVIGMEASEWCHYSCPKALPP